jgi:hypothetical protein
MGIDDTCPCGIEAHPLSPYYNPNACHIKGCKYDPKNSNFLQDMLNATIDSAALNISEKEELIKKIQGIQKTIKGES